MFILESIINNNNKIKLIINNNIMIIVIDKLTIYAKKCKKQ